MAEEFIGSLLLVPYTFAPVGWAFCNGQLLPISQYDVLFSLLGTTFGGDGVNTFGLPDLRGRTPVHVGPGFVLGQVGGVESVTLLANQLGPHSHGAVASDNAQTDQTPANEELANGSLIYATHQVADPSIAMHPNSLSLTGSSQPHENLQPYQTLNWVICTAGVYPPR